MSKPLILGIESSCDDTSVALVDADGWVKAMFSANQDEHHAIFGGVVPEIASRNHSYHMLALIEHLLVSSKTSWEDVDAIAVTSEPGLIGSLLVGVVTAKSLAFAKNKKLIAVNHLEGHIVAPFLRNETYEPQFTMDRPFVSLAVSGGHTSLYFVNSYGSYNQLGTSIDDAAGEAFDKFAKLLQLGYPGGVKVDALAKKGDPQKYDFPIALKQKSQRNFSFSGLKTSGLLQVQALAEELLEQEKANLCASYQEAIVDALLAKTKLALLDLKEKHKNIGFCITGGVSANSRLREKARQLANELNMELQIPPLKYCTDNAAMIAYAGALSYMAGDFSDLSLSASAKNTLLDFSGEKR